jgi:hypothetical protein
LTSFGDNLLFKCPNEILRIMPNPLDIDKVHMLNWSLLGIIQDRKVCAILFQYMFLSNS